MGIKKLVKGAAKSVKQGIQTGTGLIANRSTIKHGRMSKSMPGGQHDYEEGARQKKVSVLGGLFKKTGSPTRPTSMRS